MEHDQAGHLMFSGFCTHIHTHVRTPLMHCHTHKMKIHRRGKEQPAVSYSSYFQLSQQGWGLGWHSVPNNVMGRAGFCFGSKGWVKNKRQLPKATRGLLSTAGGFQGTAVTAPLQKPCRPQARVVRGGSLWYKLILHNSVACACSHC